MGLAGVVAMIAAEAAVVRHAFAVIRQRFDDPAIAHAAMTALVHHPAQLCLECL